MYIWHLFHDLRRPLDTSPVCLNDNTTVSGQRPWKRPKLVTTLPSRKERGSWWEGFHERYILSFEWNIVGVMDSDSDREEMIEF